MKNTFKDITKMLNKGDVIQIISEHLNGGMGKIVDILPTFLILGPHKDKMLEEQYGPGVLFTTAVPLEEIKLILTIVPVNNAEVVNPNIGGELTDDNNE